MDTARQSVTANQKMKPELKVQLMSKLRFRPCFKQKNLIVAVTQQAEKYLICY
jgi:hypothetical protein